MSGVPPSLFVLDPLFMVLIMLYLLLTLLLTCLLFLPQLGFGLMQLRLFNPVLARICLSWWWTMSLGSRVEIALQITLLRRGWLRGAWSRNTLPWIIRALTL